MHCAALEARWVALMPNTLRPAALDPESHSRGGSAAGQAYRDQFARDSNSASVAAGLSTHTAAIDQHQPGDSRATTRKKLSGRARLVATDTTRVVATGKLMDISATGACVLLDDMFAAKRTCTLDCDVFYQGKAYVFKTPAVSVYAVLASGKGFKVGLQFGPQDAETARIIATLLA